MGAELVLPCVAMLYGNFQDDFKAALCRNMNSSWLNPFIDCAVLKFSLVVDWFGSRSDTSVGWCFLGSLREKAIGIFLFWGLMLSWILVGCSMES
jgi:hypothetical protein